MTEARSRWILGSIGVATFVLLLVLEFATENEPYALADVVQDGVQTALLVATAVAVALLAGRMQSDREQRLSLTRDLEMARAEGEEWRNRAQSHVEGLGAAIGKQFEQWDLTGAEREAILAEVRRLNPECSFPTILVGDEVVVGSNEEKIRKALGL